MSAADRSPHFSRGSTRKEDSANGLVIHKKPDHPRPDSNITAAASSNLNPNIKPGRRRDKPQLSCNPCRNRKSRCDRKQPCSNCSSRSQTCTYAPNKYASGLPPGPPATPGTLDVQDRLVQLERLVMSLIPAAATNKVAGTIGSHETSDVDHSSGLLLQPSLDPISDSNSIRQHYVVAEHWSAILDGIADLKDHFDAGEQLNLVQDAYSSQEMGGNLNPRPPSPPGHALLLYPIHRSSRADILASLPPKDAVDRYMSYYFNHLDHASCEFLDHKKSSRWNINI